MKYDVVIIGAGVTGTALSYVLTKYTDVASIALLEAYGRTAMVSSHASHNSQTLHFGDIETNYTLEKARTVKAAAEMIVRFAWSRAENDGILTKMQKMVLAVGENEVAMLKARHDEFHGLFPGSRFVGREELRALEPKVVEGRDEATPVAAIYSRLGFGVDFGRLAAVLLEEAKKARPDGLTVSFDTPVISVRKDEGSFVVTTAAGEIQADSVVVAAGAHSLRMAHEMGYGRNLTLLPVAGDFFVGKNVLRGKVYTVQEKKLPFAAVHGDPDVTDGKMMRLGPIAIAVPLLEPGRWRTIFDFFKVFRPDPDTIATVIRVNTDPVVLKFISRHALYYLPIIGRYLFARDARKIIPTLKPSDIRFGKGLGGVRPQVADKRTRSLLLGEAKISQDGIIFNITPSPGASVCLKNAEDDTRRIVAFFEGKYRFYEAAFASDLGSTD